MKVIWLSRAKNAAQNDQQNEEWMGISDDGQFFMTGLTGVATKPSCFFCSICRKDVSVLTHGHHENMRNFEGRKDFARDRCLSLETPGWEVADYEGNVMSPAEVQRQRDRILRATLVARDRSTPFPRTSFLTRQVQWTRILGSWLRYLPSLECSVWAEVMNWCTSSGRSLICLLSESTWMLCGHVARSQLVFPSVP